MSEPEKTAAAAFDVSDLKKQLSEARAKLDAGAMPNHRQILGAALANGEALAQFFDYEHLPAQLAAVSRPFAELAARVLQLPRNAERTSALRKLLEAKDCAVRAVLAKS
jgi:hypothetical protein